MGYPPPQPKSPYSYHISRSQSNTFAEEPSILYLQWAVKYCADSLELDIVESAFHLVGGLINSALLRFPMDLEREVTKDFAAPSEVIWDSGTPHK